MAIAPESVPVPIQEKITRRAHEIWLAEGCPEGRALVHWQRAEAELNRQVLSAAPVSAPGRPGKSTKNKPKHSPSEGVRRESQ